MREALVVLASFAGIVGCVSRGLAPAPDAGDAAPDRSVLTDVADTTFACGAKPCLVGVEYCFAEQADGIPVGARQCRRLPSGCSTCSCAKTDALAVTKNCVSGGGGSFTCRDSSGALVDDQTSTPSLVMCDVP
jgi:hypothetical protein